MRLVRGEVCEVRLVRGEAALMSPFSPIPSIVCLTSTVGLMCQTFLYDLLQCLIPQSHQ